MFDVSFWEISLIAVIALLVVGPERLPGLARTAGLWIGKIRGFVGTVKADIDRELRADNLRRQMGIDQLSELEDMLKSAVEKNGKPDYLVKATDSSSSSNKEASGSAEALPSDAESKAEPGAGDTERKPDPSGK